MMRFLLCLLLFVLALPACAVQDGQVLYIGGTVSTLKGGSLGKLDTTSPTALTFVAAGTKIEIPYTQIDSCEYAEPIAHHLGVLPAIGVGLVKARRHKHIFRVVYHEDDSRPQVAIFEVSKQAARPLLAILQARAPQGCKTPPNKR